MQQTEVQKVARASSYIADSCLRSSARWSEALRVTLLVSTSKGSGCTACVRTLASVQAGTVLNTPAPVQAGTLASVQAGEKIPAFLTNFLHT